MKYQWTGGQYSLFRFIFGAYLVVHFLHLLPWAAELFSASGMLGNAGASPLMQVFPNILALSDSPLAVQGLIGSAALAAVCLAIGWRDKIATVWLWYVLACLFTRNPMIANPALPYVGWMLLAHLLVPARPWGSVGALGRTDPGGDWHMPKSVFVAAWVILAVTYSYSGYTKLLSPSWESGEMLRIVLENPLARDYFLRDAFLALPDTMLGGITYVILYLELLFAPLALSSRLRPWLWGGMLAVQFGFLFLLNFPDLTFGMLLMHTLTFDPQWLRRTRPKQPETIYYDGTCGFCHRVVRFLLAEDSQGHFRFAPLDSPHFQRRVSESERQRLPDSFVLITEHHQLLTRSSAVVHMLKRLGGFWWIGGGLLALLPKGLGDRLYDAIGARRQRLFAEPEGTCPLIPKHLRVRFLG